MYKRQVQDGVHHDKLLFRGAVSEDAVNSSCVYILPGQSAGDRRHRSVRVRIHGAVYFNLYIQADQSASSFICDFWREKMNSLPTPGVLTTLMCSPWALTISLTMDNPRPVPFLSLPRDRSDL